MKFKLLTVLLFSCAALKAHSRECYACMDCHDNGYCVRSGDCGSYYAHNSYTPQGTNCAGQMNL